MVAEHVQQFLAEKGVRKERPSLLLAVSGGLDSTVLSRVIADLGYPAHVAHVNYGLRPSAEGDERFVRTLADELELTLHVSRAHDHIRKDSGSLQETARDIRYTFFADIARQYELSHLAVAHHADDQAETFLINLFRGAGMEGLGGMKDERFLSSNQEVKLIRPLLKLPRNVLREYAMSMDWSWRDDPSNKDTAYLRNAIRHEILPLIEKRAGGGVAPKLAETAELAQSYWKHSLGPDMARRFTACRAEGPTLSVQQLVKQPCVWQHRIILEALEKWLPGAPRRRSVAREILDLLTAQPGRKVALKAGTVWRNREYLYFDKDSRDAERKVITLQIGEAIEVEDLKIRADRKSARPDQVKDSDPFTAWLSPTAVELPLRVRFWKHGDRIQPLGMDGTKTVSDLLTDEKVPPHRKASQLVVEDQVGIIWVVGVRISERAKLQPNITEALVIRAAEKG